MGDEADDVLRSFNLTEDQQKEYNVVKDRFNSHFVRKRNVIYERAKFNMRKQEGESVDAFVTDLYALAEHCLYGQLHDEMIRDRLVGLRSAQLSEKLQLDPELTLEKALTQVRQEAIKLQQAVLRGEGAVKNELPVDSVNKGKQRPAYCKKLGNRSSQPATQGCTRCGLTPTHDKTHCPARDAVCHKCGKRGHYERVSI